MIGTRLAHYDITAHLGSGGMGDVYQAVDVDLSRNVAIKILPDLFANDSERVARFEREARVLASLNSPHIAALYGLERSGTQTFLVMELVPGETLARWITQRRDGKTRLRQALSIARQIAAGLEAAHQSGVIHRDLKPANINVTPDGTVKILDFGLAKAPTPQAGAGLAQSPTITNLAAMTAAGVILGTAAYMSPEQAKGHPIDKRSDIWAFGCILYEMLTGVRLFDAPDATETIAAVLMRDPDWSQLPAGIPPPVRQLLRRCLERDRAKRMTDIAAANFALDEALAEASSTGARPEPRPRSRGAYAGWIAAAVFALVAAGLGYIVTIRSSDDAPMMRLQVSMGRASDPFTFALSPDGRSLVSLIFDQGKAQLWLRRLDTGEERPLTGSDNANFVFWSPDGRSIAFFADGWLKRLDLESGYVRKIVVTMGDPRPGTWNSSGVILYSLATSGLFKVSAEGGAPREPVTTLKPGQSSHRFSKFLPDGRRFLFLALGEPEVKGVYLGSLDSPDTIRVMDGEPAFDFLPPNYLIVTREGGLWAQQFDIKSGKLEGELIPIAPQIFVDAQMNGLAALSVSPSGSLAFYPADGTYQGIWLDREGRETGTLGDANQDQILATGFARDGRTVALRRTVAGNTDVWTMDTMSGSLHRETTSAAIDGAALLSSSGKRIYYSSDPKGALWDIYVKDVDGGPEKLLVSSPENDYAYDVSSDERYLLFSGPHANTNVDVWAQPLSDGGKPFPLVIGPAHERDAKFSPSGHWFAYRSDESGRPEVYARPFPGPGPRIQVSTDGTLGAPTWSTRGEIIYPSLAGRVTAVPVSETGSTLVLGTPRVLPSAVSGVPTPDGQRFLAMKVVTQPPPRSIILNWRPPKR